MDPNLPKANCVVIGSLNRAILQPPWLAGKGLITTGGDGSFPPMDVIFTVGSTVYKIDDTQFTWQIEAGKLIVDRSDVSSDANPGAKVVELLKILEHTPIRAVGNNFVFPVGEPISATAKSHLSNSLSDALPGGQIASINYVAECRGANLHVTADNLASEGGVQSVRLNFHRETQDNAEARLAAGEWEADLAEAKRIMDRLKETLR